MKTQPPPVNSPAVPHFTVAEARQLLELALQSESLAADCEIPDDAKHRASDAGGTLTTTSMHSADLTRHAIASGIIESSVQVTIH